MKAWRVTMDARQESNVRPVVRYSTMTHEVSVQFGAANVWMNVETAKVLIAEIRGMIDLNAASKL